MTTAERLKVLTTLRCKTCGSMANFRVEPGTYVEWTCKAMYKHRVCGWANIS